MKRFDQVVVGSGLKALHFVLPIAARGENQYRVLFSGGTRLLNQFYAIENGQAYVHNRKVVIVFLGEKQTVPTVGGLVHSKSLLGEKIHQLFANRFFVFNYQQTHKLLPLISTELTLRNGGAPFHIRTK